jgi:hypothetical protein
MTDAENKLRQIVEVFKGQVGRTLFAVSSDTATNQQSTHMDLAIPKEEMIVRLEFCKMDPFEQDTVRINFVVEEDGVHLRWIADNEMLGP